MQEKNNLNTPVRYFKGVGPKKSECLSRLGIETSRDLLYYLPARYEDRSKFIPVRQLRRGESQTIRGELQAVGSRRAKSGIPVFEATVKDLSGSIRAVWFNQPYLRDILKKGQRIVLYGRVELFDKLQIVQPEYEILETEEVDSIHMGRIVPVYSLTESVTQKYLRSLIHQTITGNNKNIMESLPTYLIAREKLVDLRFAIHNIHFPASFENLEKAYRRIVFEEFFMLQLALALKCRSARQKVSGVMVDVKGELVDAFKRALPFELTGGQKNAIADIERDMSSGKPMSRLLEGDVGSGKTAVAAYGLVMAVQNGFQGVLMAPTEVLAHQHFIVLSEMLMPLGVSVVLLASGIDQKAKERIYSEIKEGVADVVVGTHAIIQESVGFKKLGLVVIDEQHKFGVEQRQVLRQKGYSPHVLVMTATPIPRTLALTVYGDLDISVIKELPKGRKPIATYWVGEARREKVYGFIREEAAKGRQAFIVCPMIEAREASNAIRDTLYALSDTKYDVRGVLEMYEKLKNDVFPELSVGLLHGRMSSKEKEIMMKEFKKGKIDILVSTVVIEVGIDVPNASVMLIENADRFGLAQLHQLRGRVGRGVHESYCILLSDTNTEEAALRLKAMEDTLDGFEIAEADLKLRGPGEFFGTRQHGLPEIRFGNIIKDFDIMELARKEAFSLVSRDPGLKEEHHSVLKENLINRFRGKFELIKAA